MPSFPNTNTRGGSSLICKGLCSKRPNSPCIFKVVASLPTKSWCVRGLTAHSPLQSATLLSQLHHYLRWPNLHVRRFFNGDAGLLQGVLVTTRWSAHSPPPTLCTSTLDPPLSNTKADAFLFFEFYREYQIHQRRNLKLTRKQLKVASKRLEFIFCSYSEYHDMEDFFLLIYSTLL